MQIRELNIKGFGNFSETSVTGFGSGINIIYGSNEFGKTTLLEFIRRILFGFPKRKSADLNLYPALHGGAYGGEILCEMSSREQLRIYRTEGPQGGKVWVSRDVGEVQGQDHLNNLLGYASQELFQNIFAFSLDELQVFGSLQAQEIKNRIYGAGLGLGTTSIAEVEKSLQNQCDDLFKPKGKTQKMMLLWNEILSLQTDIYQIQSELSTYDDLTFKVRQLETKQKEMNRYLQDLENSRRSLETQSELYPDFVEWRDTKEDLEQIPLKLTLADEAFEILNRLKSEMSHMEERVIEEEETLHKIEQEKRLNLDYVDLLSHRQDLIALRNMTEQIRSTLQDKLAVQNKRDQLDEQIQAEIGKIGSNWEKQTISAFTITDQEKDQILEHREEIDQARQNLTIAKEKMEEFREEKARELSKGFNVPEWLRVVSFSLLGLGFAGLITSVILRDIPLVIVSLIILILGSISLRMIIKAKSSMVKEDQLGPALTERLNDAEKRSDLCFESWRNWLREKHFDELLTPLQTEKTISILWHIKSMIQQQEDYEHRFQNMQFSENKAKQLVDKIKLDAGSLNLDSNLIENIQALNQAFEEAERKHEKVAALETQIERTNNKIILIKEHWKEKNQYLQDMIISSGASNREEFETACRLLERQKETQKLLNRIQARIETRVGIGDAFKKFLQGLEKTNPEKIIQQLAFANEEWKQNQTERDKINQEIGRLGNRIEQLASNDSLTMKHSELENKKELLNRQAKRWAASKIALTLLDNAKRKYEKERQPQVIQAAEKIFATVTDKKYNRIFKPMDSDEILVDNGTGKSKGVLEMSRGTREQLYLAMRLGLIEHYEDRSEPLPVIMDDVLVNFDDSRREAVAKVLKTFSKNRQTIILSCHKDTLETYLKVGAHQIHVHPKKNAS